MKIKNNSMFSILLIMYIIAPTRLEIGGIPSPKVFLLLLIAFFLVKQKLQIRFQCAGYLLFYLMTVVAVNLFNFTVSNLIWSSLEILFILMIFPVQIKDKNDFFRIVDGFLVIVGGVAVLGIVETFTGFNIFDVISGNYVTLYGANSLRFGLTRSRGFLTTSINNAVFLGMAATLCAYRIPILEKRKKTLFIVIYVLLLANVISTLSRGIMIVFSIIHVMMWWKNKVIVNPIKLMRILIYTCIVLVILQLTGVPVGLMFKNILYMIAVIFDSSYGDYISGNFGMNLNAIGTRFDLYGYVWDAVSNKWILGNGYHSHFSVIIKNSITKTAIENTFLGYLYYGGITGLLGLVVMLLGVIGESYKKRKILAPFETVMSFDWMMIMVTLAYIVSMFIVYAVDELRLFYVLVCLAIARNRFVQK